MLYEKYSIVFKHVLPNDGIITILLILYDNAFFLMGLNRHVLMFF